MRKYKFRWELLGDCELGRPHLGALVDVSMYRLMLYTFRDVIEAQQGTDEADLAFYQAGKISGQHFYHHFIHPVTSPDEFIQKIQAVLKEKRMGLLKVEEANPEFTKLTLTLSEDLACSGLPELDDEICVYDEGFLAALFEGFTATKWTVKEIDCWCTGDRTCRFALYTVIE